MGSYSHIGLLHPRTFITALQLACQSYSFCCMLFSRDISGNQGIMRIRLAHRLLPCIPCPFHPFCTGEVIHKNLRNTFKMLGPQTRE